MKKPKEIIIPKEQAVFWMDGQGDWWNAHGRFQHKKIIEHFHSSIKHDKDGYYLEQQNGNILEKVYFSYEETALFVFRLKKNNKLITLVLNTGKEIKLDPRKLFIENEELYIRLRGKKAKFVKHGLKEISKLIDYSRMTITINGQPYPLTLI